MLIEAGRDFILERSEPVSKAGELLIAKVSEALGGIFRPYQIRRLAQAEADAAKIQAVSRIELNELQQRAMYRFVAEEAKKQANIESITEKALPGLNDAAHPENIEEDWVAHFFDKCRLVSNENMQTLWSRVLAGEANSPGRYTKRTVSLLSTMDKADAELFKALCSFVWHIGEWVPLIFDFEDPIYSAAGINFTSLTHMDDIGLFHLRSNITTVTAIITGDPLHQSESYRPCPLLLLEREEWNNSDGLAQSLGWLTLDRETIVLLIDSTVRNGMGQNFIKIHTIGKDVDITQSVTWATSLNGKHVNAFMSEKRSLTSSAQPEMQYEKPVFQWESLVASDLPRVPTKDAYRYPCLVLKH